jgi:hypothetical protein
MYWHRFLAAVCSCTWQNMHILFSFRVGNGLVFQCAACERRRFAKLWRITHWSQMAVQRWLAWHFLTVRVRNMVQPVHVTNLGLPISDEEKPNYNGKFVAMSHCSWQGCRWQDLHYPLLVFRNSCLSNVPPVTDLGLAISWDTKLQRSCSNVSLQLAIFGSGIVACPMCHLRLPYFDLYTEIKLRCTGGTFSQQFATANGRIYVYGFMDHNRK